MNKVKAIKDSMSKPFSSYYDVEEFVARNGHSRFYRNQNGEFVEIHRKENFYEIVTYQNNNHVRINVFYSDGTSEELFARGDADAQLVK